MQRNNVCSNQPQQHQWHRNHVKTEETVECGVAHHIVTPNQQSQVWTNERNRSKQIDNYLGTPVTHLPPGQQVAHKSFGHQA